MALQKISRMPKSESESECECGFIQDPKNPQPKSCGYIKGDYLGFLLPGKAPSVQYMKDGKKYLVFSVRLNRSDLPKNAIMVGTHGNVGQFSSVLPGSDGLIRMSRSSDGLFRMSRSSDLLKFI